MAKNKRKKTAATAGAITLVAALILTGTYAWRSISQEALNENLVLANPGGRLHDDWNGSNKRVYVENFTDTTYDPDNAGEVIENPNQAPIYVRVKLQEYLELGQDAGKNFNDANRKATPIVSTMDFNDKSTWTLYRPTTITNPAGWSDLFQDYVKITTATDTKLKYMPTFNKNQESLKADINGTYEGTTAGDKIHFDDYDDWETFTGTLSNGSTVGKAGDAYYYDETSTETLGTIPGSEVLYKKNADEEHEVKETLETAKLISMSDWIAYDGTSGQEKTGNYWVFDEDGWAYWAQPLEPGTATGPLITDVKLQKTAGGNCYYAINVVGEFASEDDWGDPNGGDKESAGFYWNDGKMDGLSDNALKLLNTISGASGAADHVAITATAGDITGSSATDTINVEPGATVQFSGVVTAKGKEVSDQSIAWTQTGSRAGSATALTDNGNGTATLEIADDEVAKSINVTATPGANSAAAVTYKVNVVPPKSVKVELSSGTDNGKVAPNGSLTYKATVKSATGDKYANQKVTWTVDGNNESGTTVTNGVLAVDANEKAGTILTIKAKSQTDGDVYGTATVRVTTSTLPLETLETIDEVKVNSDGVLYGTKTGADGSILGNANNTKTVKIDGVEFYVVAKKDGKALLLAKEKLEEKAFGATGADWTTSTLRTYLNSDTASTGWLDGKTNLKGAALSTEVVSGAGNDQIFLLSKEDIYGGASNLTAGVQLVAPNSSWVAKWTTNSTLWWSLRTASSDKVDVVGTTGAHATEDVTSTNGGVRPACWVSL